MPFAGRSNRTRKTTNPAVATTNPEIERLWAFAAIEEKLQEIEDFGDKADIEQAVVDLGVEYGLVTPYTSMVVVREEVFHQLGIARANRDRLAVEQQASEQQEGKWTAGGVAVAAAWRAVDRVRVAPGCVATCDGAGSVGRPHPHSGMIGSGALVIGDRA